MANKGEVGINNAFNQMDWEKILLKDFGTCKFHDQCPRENLTKCC